MMSERDIAGAIADGIAMHASAHPEDADRKFDGVVANQCLMGTLGFADALSEAGVTRLAASNEIMIAPGVPTTVASAIARHLDDPQAMAQSVVAATMAARYAIGGEAFAPAASFSVLDTTPETIAQIRTAVKTLDDDLATAIKKDPALAPHVRADEQTCMAWRVARKQHFLGARIGPLSLSTTNSRATRVFRKTFVMTRLRPRRRFAARFSRIARAASLHRMAASATRTRSGRPFTHRFAKTRSIRGFPR